jgi:hypothetical membrane protein
MRHLRQPPAATCPDPRVPGWVVLSAILAPLSLIIGWLVAGLVQPGAYDPVSQTISVLAGRSASERWIMTVGLYLVASSQILTAAGFASGPLRARILLAIGGVMGLGVAVFPQPAHGSAPAHLVFATLSISMLAVWPATVASRDPSRPRVLSLRSSMLATAGLLALLAWLFVAGHGAGGLGVAERVDTAAGNSWPLVVILAIRRHSARGLAPRDVRMT